MGRTIWFFLFLFLDLLRLRLLALQQGTCIPSILSQKIRVALIACAMGLVQKLSSGMLEHALTKRIHMPITPLHFGIATPLKVIRGDKFSVPAFIWANCIMDIEPIAKVLFELPGELHEGTHNYATAGVLAWFCWLFTKAVYRLPDCRPQRINEGFAWGAGTHVFVDSLVHADLNPLWPLLGNPFYTGQMGWVSLICFGFLVGGLACFTGPVSGSQRRALKRLERTRAYFAALWSKAR